ncbi:MAG: WbqC family protein [Planctomycetes bacterium]|nr:WbqC family protein [Planctomycetota bacterium]
MAGGLCLVTAHQANYLPYLGFFEKISVSDLFVLVDDTQFVKRGAFGWIHRNRILGPNGPQWLTVPVQTHERYHQKISETKISNGINWRRKHLRAIEVAYRKSPYYKEYYPFFEEFYHKEWVNLLDISQVFIEWCMGILEIKTPLLLSSSLGLKGQSSEYVLELAQKSGASHYLSGIHGRDYLALDEFEEHKMGLVFQEFKCLSYPQSSNKGEFISHLSILDALFNVGAEGVKELMVKGAQYELPKS